MEIISAHHLQRYEKILEQINREYEKSEQLRKEIQQEDDKIVALKLCASSCDQKISHVNVKVFNTVLEIYSLYGDDVNQCDFLELNKLDNCKFYLVEVILAKCLLDKLVGSEWRVRICVRYDNVCSCKVVSLQNNTNLMEILPIDSKVRECVVETCLFLCDEDDCYTIDLHTVKVDVSYFFESFKEKHNTSSLTEKLLNITRLYNSNNLAGLIIEPTLQLQSQFKIDLNKSNFITSIIRNSYHKLDLELFSEFSSGSKNIVDAHFAVDNKKIVLLYNKSSKVLKVKCCASEMLLVKKFFIKHTTQDHNEFMKKLKDIASQGESLDDMDFDETVSLYQTLRKIWV